MRLIRGNPGKRRINPGEAKPPAATPAFDTPPIELAGDPIAEAEWRRVAPMLRNCRLATEAERTVLLALCQQWSRYLEAQTKIRALGMLVKTPKGVPIANPFLAIADKALAHCHRLWVELGLTPSGRARITALPDHSSQDGSKWDGLLSGVTDARNL
jgi:P27 family predicted phage terminase small subunit